MASHFSPATFRFLRGLARHNDRVWFEERRATYESSCKEPLLAVVGAINAALADFAPEYVRPPHKVAMRIYRDIRFSPDKRPYKRNLGAWWARQGFERHDRAGFYLQVGPEGVFAAAGAYAPQRDDLLALRRWLAEEHARYRALVDPLLAPEGGLHALAPNGLTRNPKGFAPDHPASELLRARNWGVLAPFTEEQAVAPDFAERVAASFARTAPVVELLNGAFAEAPSPRAGYFAL